MTEKVKYKLVGNGEFENVTPNNLEEHEDVHGEVRNEEEVCDVHTEYEGDSDTLEDMFDSDDERMTIFSCDKQEV